MKGLNLEPTHSESVKITHEKDGITYFEKGWWAKTEDWKKAWQHQQTLNSKNVFKYSKQDVVMTFRPNKETKELELDEFLLPK